MGELPSWVNIGKISSMGVIVLAIVQYCKVYIPEKWIKLFTIGIGIAISIVGDCCTGGTINWVQTLVNGVLAAVLADTGYSFLSGKGGSTFKLPSK